MRLIHELLSKYTNITPPDAVVRKQLSKLIATEAVPTITEKDIRIIGPIAYCSLPSAAKNELFMKKGAVLNKLTEIFGRQVVKDIQ